MRKDVAVQPECQGRTRHAGLEIDKSNWANTIEEPPFEAYQVACGITFTFGGLRIERDAQVVDVDMEPIPGLYAAGEVVGGLFYFNYPGGTGLTSGASSAAPRATRRRPPKPPPERTGSVAGVNDLSRFRTEGASRPALKCRVPPTAPAATRELSPPANTQTARTRTGALISVGSTIDRTKNWNSIKNNVAGEERMVDMARVWDTFLTERDREVLTAAGYGARAGFGKRPALLIIDVSYGFAGDRPI